MDMTYDFPYICYNFLSSLPKHEIQWNIEYHYFLLPNIKW
jgi:hypothetical protein